MTGNKVIIYGYNNLGSKVATLLKTKHYEVIIVDIDKRNCIKARKEGYEVFNYELMDDEELIAIDINNKNIKAFFCMSKSEQNNLFVTLSVRNLNKKIKIISIGKTKEENQKMILAGATKVINPYEIGALRIIKLLHQPLVLDVIDDILFGSSDLNIAEFTVSQKSKLTGKYLNEFDFSQEFNILIIGVADKELGDKFIFNAKEINHKIEKGDTLVAMGYSKDLEKFRNII